MPQLTSPLSTPVGMPMFNAAHIGKLAGAWMHFPTFTAFQSAVLAEQNLVATGDGLWADGQSMTIASEAASRAVRVWSVPLNHARTVRLGSAQLVLAGASNTVLATTGAPSNATGNNGDVAADWTAGRYYVKTAGAWVDTGALGTGSGRIPIPADNVGTSVSLQATANLTAQALGGQLSLEASGAAVVAATGIFLNSQGPATLSARSNANSAIVQSWGAVELISNQNAAGGAAGSILMEAQGGGLTEPYVSMVAAGDVRLSVGLAGKLRLVRYKGEGGQVIAAPNADQTVTVGNVGPGSAAVSIKRWIPVTVDGQDGWIPHFGV